MLLSMIKLLIISFLFCLTKSIPICYIPHPKNICKCMHLLYFGMCFPTENLGASLKYM